MATSGKLTLRGIPKPQCHECAFLIPVSEKRRSRYDGGKSRIDPFLSFHWDRGEEACKIYLLTARSFSTGPFKADNCITLHCTFRYLWGITWFLGGLIKCDVFKTKKTKKKINWSPRSSHLTVDFMKALHVSSSSSKYFHLDTFLIFSSHINVTVCTKKKFLISWRFRSNSDISSVFKEHTHLENSDEYFSRKVSACA